MLPVLFFAPSNLIKLLSQAVGYQPGQYCQNNYKFFDFGRSIPGSGVHRFKESFGAETKYLHYQYYLNSQDKVPDFTMSHPKRQMFAKIWKNLPLSIANLIGPKLRRNFP